MKRMKTVLVLLVICGVAACQSYIDFRKPMRLLYGGDTLIISLQGDSVIFSGEASELVLRDSTLLEIIQAHGGTGGTGTSDVWKISNDTIFLIDGSQVINLSNGTSKPKIRIDNSSTGNGLAIFTSSTGSGIHINNSSSSTGKGLNISNSSGGQGIRLINSSTGIGLWLDNNSTGTGIKVASGTAGTGDVFISTRGAFSADTTFKVTSTGALSIKDSLKLLLFEGHNLYPWLTLINSNVDTLQTENASWVGLVMPQSKPSEYLNDQEEVDGHKELLIYYVDSETKELKSQRGWGRLDMMETQSAYQIFHERALRYIVDQEKQIDSLQKQVDQNKRSVLKRKVKDMEQRLEAIENIVHGR